jgi:hypothetical protein
MGRPLGCFFITFSPSLEKSLELWDNRYGRGVAWHGAAWLGLARRGVARQGVAGEGVFGPLK